MPDPTPLPPFESLLDAILDEPHRCAELTAHLHATFTRKKAILVLDMCGFSRTTQERGIVTFLLMIRRMRRICEACFLEHGGERVRAEADNLFYLFDSASEAVAASREALLRLAEGNRAMAPEEHLTCAIGIGYGEVLCLSSSEIHGHEVNIAWKLGEDVASNGQVLLTEAAYRALGATAPHAQARTVALSGLELCCHELIITPSPKRHVSG